MNNHINLIGVELEGGWKKHPNHPNCHPDGSIQLLHACHNNNDCNCKETRNYTPKARYGELAYIGEISSDPMKPEDLKNLLDNFFPDETNETCGYHVHFSLLENSDYLRLMDKRFYRYFLARMRAWGRKMEFPEDHQFWKRLNGAVHYCQKEFCPDSQVNHEHVPNRYTQLNYCYRQHGTIECRLFPAFESKEYAQAATEELIDTVNAYLTKQEKLPEYNLEMTISLEEAW